MLLTLEADAIRYCFGAQGQGGCNTWEVLKSSGEVLRDVIDDDDDEIGDSTDRCEKINLISGICDRTKYLVGY